MRSVKARKMTKFNAVSYQRRLCESGISVMTAQVIAEETQNILNNDIATKQDIAHLENKMIIKLGSLVVGCTFIISIMIAVLGFLLKQQ
jgi:hypothetical protein